MGQAVLNTAKLCAPWKPLAGQSIKEHIMNKKNPILFVLLLMAMVMLAAESYVRVTVSFANIRSNPSTNAKIVEQVKQGTLLLLLEKKESWFYVKNIKSKAEGYIHKNIVELIETKESSDKSDKAIREETASTKERKKQIQKPEKKVNKKVPKRKIERDEKRIYLKAGYMMGNLSETVTNSWSETLYQETGDFSLAYSMAKGNSIFGAVGFLFSKSMGIEVGADLNKRSISGSYTFVLPHPLWLNSPRTVEGSDYSAELKETVLFFNLVLKIPLNMIDLELFGGGAYFLVSGIFITALSFNDVYPYTSVSVSFSSESLSQKVFGFNGGAAVTINIHKVIGVFVQGSYFSGKTEFASDSSISAVNVSLGGLKFGGGIKIKL
jgi:hypothetical protein